MTKTLNNITTFENCMEKTKDINIMRTLNDLEDTLSDLELTKFKYYENCKFYDYFKKKNLLKDIDEIKIKRSKLKKHRVEIRKND